MKERLALSRSAREIAGTAIGGNLREMSPHRFPAANLSRIIRMPPPTIVSTIPLEPSPRVIRMDPPLRPPHRERLARVHPEEVALRVALLGSELRPPKPRFRKFPPPVAKVNTAKDAKLKHFPRCKVRFEFRIKMLPLRLREFIPIPPLHGIVYDDGLMIHTRSQCSRTSLWKVFLINWLKLCSIQSSDKPFVCRLECSPL